MRLKDKSAIITGAASGIGKDIALGFAREGAKVAIADLKQEAADATAAEIRAVGGIAMGVTMDVADEQAVNMGVAAVVAEFGGVDVLVSNAGIQIVHPIDEFPFAEWKKMLAIHLDGAFLTTKACLPHMYKSGRRQHHLHRFGSLQRGVAVKSSLRDRQAWLDRSLQGRRQGGREARRSCQRGLSGLCAYAPSGQTDSRAGKRTGHL